MVCSDDLLTHALAHHQAGRLQEAEALYEQILAREPKNPDALHLKGVLCQQLGNPKGAIDLIRLAIHYQPVNTNFYVNLGRTLLQQGKPAQIEESIRIFQEGLRYQPHQPQFYLYLGHSHQAAGQIEDALTAYQTALDLNPQYPEVFEALGTLLCEAGRPREAIPFYRQLLELAPDHAEAHYNLGICYQQSGMLEEAMASYEQAATLAPDMVNAYRNLGALFHEHREIHKAVYWYSRALEVNPEHPDAADIWNNLGNALYDQGKWEEALPYFAKALSLEPHQPLWRFRMQTLCPIIPKNWDEIADYRIRLTQNLNEAMAHPFPIDLEELPTSGCEASFFQAYQGINDCKIRSRYGDFFSALFSEQYPDLISPPTPRKHEKPRIAFLVTEHHEWIFGNFMTGFLDHLSREKLHLTVACPPASIPLLQIRLKNPGVEFLPLPTGFADTVQTIKAQQFDVMVYFEVGTDSMNYFLPYFRLAPVQCATWGIPNSTGIPAMDYYLSSSALEVPHAQEHYREKLVLFDNIPVYFYPPAIPPLTKTRQDYGLPEDKTLYFCPQSLFKFHPDFDVLLGSLLRSDPNGELLLIGGKYDHWQEILKARFNNSIRDVLDRVRFLPRLHNTDYLNVLNLSDVMIDTTVYGGGYTNYEAFSLGIPIVTLPGEFMRGRMTLACYEKMGIMDCVANTPEEYIEKTIRIGKDKAYRNSLQERILNASPAIYQTMAAVQEWENFLVKAAEEARYGHGGA